MSKWIGLIGCIFVLSVGCDSDERMVGTDTGVGSDSGTATDGGTNTDGGTGTDGAAGTDSGTVTDGGAGVDTGAGTDAGTGTDAAPSECGDIDGVYAVTPVAGNPALCERVSVTSCTAMSSGGSTVALACGSIMTDCTLDSDCVCTGMATIMMIPGMIAIDFPMNTAQLSAFGQMCNYTIAIEE